MKRKILLGTLFVLTIFATTIFINSTSAEKTAAGEAAAPAATLLVEDFTYAAGSALTANGWTAHSAGGTNPIVTSAPSLSVAGYPSSGVGNAISLATSGEDVNRAFAVQTSGSVYAAFMINVSEASTDPAGGYFFHLGPDPVGTTFRGRVFVKKDASNNIAFGISKAATVAADIAFTPFSYSLNTTYLLVVKYTIVDGATNDTVSLFVSATTPATEPAPTVSATDIATQSDINPGTVSLRQGATTTSPTARVDGIRVGNTWADVTQAPAPGDAPVDFNGDGKTDFVVVRNTGGGPNGQLTWFWNINGGGGTQAADWGLNLDTRLTEDFDGDGKDDIAVWRGGSAGSSFFYILQSQSSTVRTVTFGQAGDNARVTADYDGDGKADPAVYRPGSQSVWYYLGSLNNPSGNITYVPWGTTGDVPAPGDYDGDDKNDFVVGRNTGGSLRYYMLRSTAGVGGAVFGLFTDSIVPGDYDGDGKTDLAVARLQGGAWNWYIQPSTGGSFLQIIHGASGDSLVPGDYDGDGRTDSAVWRPTGGVFWIRSTASGAVTNFTLGASGDYPVATARTF